MLYGSVSWYYFGGLPFFRWSACLDFAGLLHLCGICFHQRGMIASKKLGHPYLLFARANCARTVSTFMCLLCFLSKNENNNGFGTIGLNSSPFDFKHVVKIHFTVVFLIVFPSCSVLDWVGNLHNEHHLAAKNGTCSAC
jgi:hypothetical protein